MAAAGVGFAGYVYFVPYLAMRHAVGFRQAELTSERGAAEAAIAERDRLQAALAKYTGSDRTAADAEAKRKGMIESLAIELKPGMEGLGGTAFTDGRVVGVSFAAGRVIDSNGIDVSPAGGAALKIVAAAAKKMGAKVLVFARASAAPPPKKLRSLFRSAGEMQAVRAARVMSALEAAGMPPSSILIAGLPDIPPARSGRTRKPPPPPPDRVDLEIEPG